MGWTAYGELGSYEPNKNEADLLDEIVNHTKDDKRIDVVLVRYDEIEKRYFVLFSILNADGSIRIRRDKDLESFKSFYDLN